MKTVELLDVEVQLLKQLLGDLSNRYACASCNELEIESSPEMRLLVAIIETGWSDRNNVPNEDRLGVDHTPEGKITTMDFMVLEHFQKKLGIEL